MKLAILRRPTVLFLCTIILLSLSGCWSAHELTDRYIVLGVAIDKSDDKILLTLQAIRPEKATSAASSDSNTGSSQASSFFLLSGEGRTIDEARKDISRRAPRIVYGGHNLVYFVGKEVAQEGLMPYIDAFARNHLSQESTWLVIADGRGQDMLGVNNILSQTSAMSLIDSVKTKELIIPTLHEFMLRIHQDSEGQVLASAKIVPNDNVLPDYQMDQLLLQENALLRGDKLVGYLSAEETDVHDWFKNGFRNAPLIIEDSPLCPDQPVGVKLKGKPAKFKVVEEGEKGLTLKVSVKVEVSLTELPCDTKFNLQDSVPALEDAVNEELTRRALALISRTQQEQLDVWGFADYLHAHNPTLWYEVKDHWSELYSTLPIGISIDCHLRDTSIMLSNPEQKN